MVQARLQGSLSNAVADIAIESLVSEFRPCQRFGHLPYLLLPTVATILQVNIKINFVMFLCVG